MKAEVFNYAWAVNEINKRGNLDADSSEGFLKHLIRELALDPTLESIRSGGFLVRYLGEDDLVEIFLDSPSVGWQEFEVNLEGDY